MPSEWYENNPMTIIESYSVGTPVIGANIGGIPEIIVEGKTGYLFENGIVEDLKKKLKEAKGLSNSEYEGLSKGTLDFACNKLSLDSYMPKLISFYSKFIQK